MVNLTFDIENRGTEPLEIYGLSIAGVDATEFALISPTTFPFTVPLAGSQTVTVQFDGTSLGTKNAQLLITSNDADESTCIVNLRGVGTNDVPGITIKYQDEVKECGSGLISVSAPYTDSQHRS